MICKVMNNSKILLLFGVFLFSIVFTNATKDMIIQYQSDVVSFLDNTNTYMTCGGGTVEAFVTVTVKSSKNCE